MMTQCLDGTWRYRIGNGPYTVKKVPFSAHCVGRSEVCTTFDRENRQPRAFLQFEGITYHGTVYLNGQLLGDMLPYSRYTFEITDIIRDKCNELSVILEDIHVPFGPSEGWENYGGIIRSVSVFYRGEGVINDITWVAKLNEDLDTAACTIYAETDAPEDAKVIYELTDREGCPVHTETTSPGKSCTFEVECPVLWSPDMPYLYTLTTTVMANDTISDHKVQKVGFKAFRTKDRRFVLNGKPLFLVGVCRHDLYGDNGHTADYAEIRRDMELIKSAGVNFVRLVHYPHDERVLDMADELGLLISEEPGLWWSDMHNKEICEGSLEVLRRTVKRDKNHISVAFWLSFNECIFTEEYLKDAIRVCREEDPYHMVSGANCMSIDMTKDFFTRCSMDFFTMHPYAPTPDLMKEHAEALGTLDRPLMFTEWGGYFVHDNPALLTRFIDYLKECWRNKGDKPVIAGACLWMWAEMFEFSRAEPACADGILHESLVDRFRNPGPNFEAFRRAFADINYPVSTEYIELETLLLCETGKTVPIDILKYQQDDELWEEACEAARQPIEKFYYKFKRERNIKRGPRMAFKDMFNPNIEMLAGINTSIFRPAHPIVIPFGKSVTIPVGQTARAVYFFGNVSLPKGWPISGEYGEEIGGYTIRYADGTSTKRILKNGEDITTVTGVFGPSRIDPRAANAPRVLSFSHDYDREQYHINLLKVETKSDAPITEINIWVTAPDYYLLTYGISLAID